MSDGTVVGGLSSFGPPPEDLEVSMPLEPMRLSVIGEQWPALKDLLTELVASHPTKLTSDQRHKLRDTYRQILLNVIYNSIRRVCTAVPRNKEAFDPDTYWNSLGLSYRFTVTSLDRLLQEGLIHQAIGFHNPVSGFGRSTRIFGTDKLAELIGVDAIAEHISVEHDDRTLVLKGFGFDASALAPDHPDILRLKIINEFLDGFSWMQKGPIRLVYSGGPMRGGRVYSRFQNLPRQVRRTMTISGEQTIEIDYSANHLRMLLVSTGYVPTDDPYTAIAEAAGATREQVKAFINVSLSAESANTAFNACKKSRINRKLFDTLTTATTTLYPDLPLHCSFGVMLQAFEGQIALDIMVDGALSGTPVLPVHDSFITTVGNEDWLIDRMKHYWKVHNNTNVEPRLSIK